LNAAARWLAANAGAMPVCSMIESRRPLRRSIVRIATQILRSRNVGFIAARVWSFTAVDPTHGVMHAGAVPHVPPSPVERVATCDPQEVCRLVTPISGMESSAMKHGSVGILDDLVATARDGKSFYEHAATRVRSSKLRTLFVRTANVKGEIVRWLSVETRMGGDRYAETGTWAGDFNRLYADVRAHLADRNYTCVVVLLEESEEQLLKALFRAIVDVDTPPHAKAVIDRLLPEVRHCQKLMREQKNIALKKAA
jgi:uncharacterized protein (TIGR02284 family)